MSQKKIDCALIFALEEEFKIIFEHKDVHKEGEFVKFNFSDSNGSERFCIAGYVSKPGSLNAYEYLKKFYLEYIPEYVFIIGISGQISDDLKVGDVVLAESVDKYDYDSKVKNGEYKFSGDVVNLNSIQSVKNKLDSFKNPILGEWKSLAQKYLNSMISSQESEQISNLGFIRPYGGIKVFLGKIATGESVVDDANFKKMITEKDRKILCVDMESYGFAKAVMPETTLLIIRAISDTADGRKKELDNFPGKPEFFRKWSLSNTFTFFNSIVLKSLKFSENEEKRIEFKSDTVKHLEKKISQNSILYFEKYSSLFKHLILSKLEDIGDTNIFEYLVQKILNNDAKELWSVQGNSGTGKSTFLYLLYEYLKTQVRSVYYIDLHTYKKEKSKESIDKFNARIQLLTSTSGKILVIDGIDRYERFFRNSEITISKVWDTLTKNFGKIIIGITTQDYNNEEDEIIPFYLPEIAIKIELDSFKFENTNLNLLITNLLFINEKALDGRIKKIEDFLIATGLKEIDWLNANLVVNKIGTTNYDDISTTGRFYYRYAKEYFSKISGEDTIETAAEMAFKKFIKEGRLTDDEYNSPIWEFIQRSNMIKQFLIAEHLIQKYIRLSDEFDNSVQDLKHIYSYRINSYFKDTLNRNDTVQRKIFSPITKNYEKLSLSQKPNVCYILGRLKSPELQTESKNILRRELVACIQEYNEKRYANDENKFRQHLLLIRTIYISLVYQGDNTASRGYLKYLLNDKDWDDLNRGFHLEYYGDKPYDPQKLGLHNDDSSVTFNKTFERLSRRIIDAIEYPDKNYYPMIDIELHTITSLAVNRHIHGFLEEDIRTLITSILKSVLENQIKLIQNTELKPYILFAFNTLDRPTTSLYNNFSEVYKIKCIPRSGWNYVGPNREGEHVKRRVANSESVPDHIYGTIMLAVFFLPEKLEGESGYSKDDVIKTLFLHDLAEYYTGDILSFLKTESDKKKENEVIRMTLALDNIKGIANLSEYKKLWSNFFTKTTMTARVAADIDKIEQLLQLIIYSEINGNEISDFEKWKSGLVDAIDTETGKRIVDLLLSKK